MVSRTADLLLGLGQKTPCSHIQGIHNQNILAHQTLNLKHQPAHWSWKTR